MPEGRPNGAHRDEAVKGTLNMSPASRLGCLELALPRLRPALAAS